MEILHSKVSLIIFNLIINQQNPYKIEKIYVWEQTLFSKRPNFLDRQVGQKIEYLSKLIFVHTRVLGRQGRPSLDICPNFRSFFFIEGFPYSMQSKCTTFLYERMRISPGVCATQYPCHSKAPGTCQGGAAAASGTWRTS